MSIEPEPPLTSNKSEFTETDIDKIVYEILPKAKKNVLYVCLIFFLLIPTMPFLPAKISHNSMIQWLSYEEALAISCVANGLVIFYIYYSGIIRLNKDIDEGHKYLYTTRLLRKTWKGNNNFEIELSKRPESLREKIIVSKDEFYNWYKNDLLEIEYLKRTGRILAYRKIET